jgi:hypothetical protein
MKPWWMSILIGPLTALGLAGVAVTQGDSYHVGGHSFSWPFTLLVVVGVISIGGTIETAIKIHSLEDRVRDRNNLETRSTSAETGLIDLVCQELANIVKIHGLFSAGRASLYICRVDHFVLVGRSSPNPKYGRSIGRKTYPINSGLLAEAWSLGQVEDSNFPDPGHGETPKRGWLERQMKRGVDEPTACNFTMRSRSYAAVRLNLHEAPLGVLVVESDRVPTIIGDGGAGPTLASLAGLQSSFLILSRALSHLQGLEESDLRSRVIAYLPIH